MDLQTCYNQLGGNYEEAKGRLMTDRIVEKFILKFPNDPTMRQLLDAVASGDVETSFRAAHTLKGVAANLSFSALQQSASALTEQLRSRDQQADPALLQDLERVYQMTIDAIATYQSQL